MNQSKWFSISTPAKELESWRLGKTPSRACGDSLLEHGGDLLNVHDALIPRIPATGIPRGKKGVLSQIIENQPRKNRNHEHERLPQNRRSRPTL